MADKTIPIDPAAWGTRTDTPTVMYLADGVVARLHEGGFTAELEDDDGPDIRVEAAQIGEGMPWRVVDPDYRLPMRAATAIALGRLLIQAGMLCRNLTSAEGYRAASRGTVDE